MILNEKEKDFIKANSDTLEDLFKKRIEELKNSIFSMEDKEKRDLEIRFVQEFQEWLGVIGILKQTKKTKKKNYI